MNESIFGIRNSTMWGREFGPVSATQLRQWIAEGRANSQTNVQTDGSSEWVLLGTLIEFADAFASAVPPPPIAAVEAQREARETLLHDYRIIIGDCFGRAWELLKRDFWFLLGASVVAGLIGAGGFIPYLGVVASLCTIGVRNCVQHFYLEPQIYRKIKAAAWGYS